MKNIAVVTTFNDKGYQLYGKKMIQGFIDHWPKNATLYVYVEESVPTERADNVVYVDFNSAVPELMLFKDRHLDNPRAHGKEHLHDKFGKPLFTKKNKPKGIGFIWDAVRFSHKIYAITHAGLTCKEDLLFWLDADVRTFATIPPFFLEKILRDPIYTCYLGRVHKFTECGFVGYNLKHPMNAEFMKAMKHQYDSDKIFRMDGWTDCHVFDSVRERFEAQGMTNNNISRDLNIKEGHPFINSDLGQYMDHLKGDRKQTGKSHSHDLLVKRQEAYWK